MIKHGSGLFAGVVLLVLVFSQLTAQPASAGGVVGTGTPASCTEAAFDAAWAGGGVVTFNCGGAATIILTSQKSLVADVTFNGAGLITLSGNNLTRLLVANGGVLLTLNNMTLTAGSTAVGGALIEGTGAQIVVNGSRLTNSTATDQGGAIYCYVGTGGTLAVNNSVISGNSAARGGGIYNDGCVMSVSNSLFSGNSTVGAGSQRGGGLYTDGPLTVTNSTFTNNSGFDGGGVYVSSNAVATLSRVALLANSGSYGAGLENSGTVTITDSLISGNTALNDGGGIWNLDGRVVMRRTTVRDNRGSQGGGINSYGNRVELADVNVSGNTATGSTGGGGIYHGGGTMFITNATISTNQATGVGGNGGGIHQNSNDNLTLTNVTLSNNTAAGFGGGLYHLARYAVLTNVTIGRNTALAGDAIYEASVSGDPNVVQVKNTAIFGSANNCDGSLFVSLGHNVSQGTCASLVAATDQPNVPAVQMGALTNNGGAFAMLTIMPLPGSPVINAGDPAACPTLDQRGAARVGTCDVGAVEFGAVLPRLYLPLLVR
ncbi:MAG: right-handed parallel beta-helix repeat-containing protein [Herpetosiphonaceae bacterium]|nr:right-handed parallel beta-helix repeat-containing protein [Herpetosiphonaceae bacterium]